MIEKSKLKKLGKILLITFGISTIGLIYWMLFTWPIYIIGIYLIWKSELNKWTKFAWCILPILPVTFFVILLSSIDSGYESSKQTDVNNNRFTNNIECRFVLNNNFDKSNIGVIINNKCSAVASALNYKDFTDYETSRNVIEYEIPNNGIITIRENLAATRRAKFFIKNASGKLEELEYNENKVERENKLTISGCQHKYRTLKNQKNSSEIRFITFSLTDTRKNRKIKTTADFTELIRRIETQIQMCN